MPTITLTPQDVGRSGIKPTYTALDSGDTMVFSYTGKEMIHFKLTTNTNVIATFPFGVSVDQHAVSSRTVTIAAADDERFVGSFLPVQKNAAGQIQFTVDRDDSGLSAAVLRMG